MKFATGNARSAINLACLNSRRRVCMAIKSWDGFARPRLEEFTLVRHGESEGNLAFNASVAGDHSLYSGPFMQRHSSFWRLTDRGREQALITGEWMKANMDVRFDGLFSSEYLRAMETAALLGLPGARWRPEVMLRERDWGEYDLMSQQERRAAYQQYEARRRRESLFWAPPGGESLAQVIQRVDSMLLFTNRRFGGGRALMVAHGEVMWAFRLRFERLTQLRYREMQADPQVHDRIHNCQVLTYSRRCPETGELYPDFRFMRSVCPWDLSLTPSEWRSIDRSRSGERGLTDGQMLAAVGQCGTGTPGHTPLNDTYDTHFGRYKRLLNDEDAPGAGAVVQDQLHPSFTLEQSSLGQSVSDANGDADADSSSISGAAVCRAVGQPAHRILLLTKTARWRILVDSITAAAEHHTAGAAAADRIDAGIEGVGSGLPYELSDSEQMQFACEVRTAVEAYSA